MLLRLADPQTRGGLLDSEALLAVAAVCYEFDPALAIGPTTAIVDRVDMAVPIMPEMAVSARLMRAGDALPWDVTATWDPALPPVPGADAVLVGSVAVRVGGGAGTIEEVDVSEPDLDAAFAAALAGLPPTATAEQVRASLRLAAATTLADPPLTDLELDAILAGAGGSILAGAGGSGAGGSGAGGSGPGGSDRGDPRVLGRAVGGRDALGLSLTMSAEASPASATPADWSCSRSDVTTAASSESPPTPQPV